MCMQKFIFLITSIVAILVNVSDIYKLWGGKSIAQLSDTTATSIITPIGATFAIWGIIFLSWLIIGVANVKNSNLLNKKAINYHICSMVSICLWVVAFTLGNTFLASILLFAILFFNVLVSQNMPSKIKHFYLIYTSWTTIASVISFTILLQYNLGIKSILGIQNSIIALLVLGVGTVIFGFLARYFESITPLLVGAWAYVGIFRVLPMVQSDTIIKNGALIYAIAMLVLSSITIYQNKKLITPKFFGTKS